MRADLLGATVGPLRLKSAPCGWLNLMKIRVSKSFWGATRAKLASEKNSWFQAEFGPNRKRLIGLVHAWYSHAVVQYARAVQRNPNTKSLLRIVRTKTHFCTACKKRHALENESVAYLFMTWLIIGRPATRAATAP